MPFKTNFHSEKKGFSSNIDHFRSEFLRLPKDGGASARPKSGTRLVENWQNAKRDLGGRREKVRHRRKRRPERWPSNRPSIEEALFFGGGGGRLSEKKSLPQHSEPKRRWLGLGDDREKKFEKENSRLWRPRKKPKRERRRFRCAAVTQRRRRFSLSLSPRRRAVSAPAPSTPTLDPQRSAAVYF